MPWRQRRLERHAVRLSAPVLPRATSLPRPQSEFLAQFGAIPRRQAHIKFHRSISKTPLWSVRNAESISVFVASRTPALSRQQIGARVLNFWKLIIALIIILRVAGRICGSWE